MLPDTYPISPPEVRPGGGANHGIGVLLAQPWPGRRNRETSRRGPEFLPLRMTVFEDVIGSQRHTPPQMGAYMRLGEASHYSLKGFVRCGRIRDAATENDVCDQHAVCNDIVEHINAGELAPVTLRLDGSVLISVSELGGRPA